MRPTTLRARSGVFAVLLLSGVVVLPAPAQERPVALVGGRILPVEGPEIPSGTVYFHRGRILAVGAEVALPPGTRVVDVSGKTVAPGLLNSFTELGRYEIGRVDVTLDRRDAGDLRPDVETLVAVNPHSAHIGVTRSAGVTAAFTAPLGATIAGQGALVRMAGWTWREMAVPDTAALVCRLPFSPRPARRTREAMEALEAFLEEARRFARAREEGAPEPLPPLPRHEAVLPYLERRLPVFLQATRAAEVRQALAFAEEHGLNAVLVGLQHAAEAAAEIAEAGVPCLVGPITAMPAARQPYDQVLALPAALHRAGVRFALVTGGVADARNLPIHAGMAVAFGLPPEAALAAVTLEPARILGVSDRMGSLARGKEANLIVCDGHPLEAATRVERTFILGEEPPEPDLHTALYERFHRRPPPPGTGEER